MSDLRVFRHRPANGAIELRQVGVTVERDLQRFVEANMDVVLGVRLVASEYPTGNVHRGRPDSLGLDADDRPVIVEYKRGRADGVVAQLLFYLDWLVDHRAEFERLVATRLGKQAARHIDWSSPRLICVAADFGRYEAHAVRQLSHSVELLRFRAYDEDFLVIESAASSPRAGTARPAPAAPSTAHLTGLSSGSPVAQQSVEDLFAQVHSAAAALGSDVRVELRKHYTAYRRTRNFACVRTQRSGLLMYLPLDPGSVPLAAGFTRDVRGVGHLGTGDLEVRITSAGDVRRAVPLLERSYQGV
ncbi:resuscitation-promoting factor Rpf1 domain-containing protein [Streptomyces carpaticus]|uniref:resuscitation-promoting factor Rpf1 domain-containing protein n=1 Tax=Streptomyces carpaticus TaxID=285558 RepID=UPI0031F738FC